MVGCVGYIRSVKSLILLWLVLSSILCQIHFVSNLLCFDNSVSLSVQDLSRRVIGNVIRSDLAHVAVRFVLFVASLVSPRLLMLFISIFISPNQFSSNESILTFMCLSLSSTCFVGLLKILLAPVRTMGRYGAVRFVSQIFAPLCYSEMLLTNSRLPLIIYSSISSLYYVDILSQCSDLSFQFGTITNSSSTAFFNSIIGVRLWFWIKILVYSLFYPPQINLSEHVGRPLLSRFVTSFMMVRIMRCGLRPYQKLRSHSI